jgi:hypothetical protein
MLKTPVGIGKLRIDEQDFHLTILLLWFEASSFLLRRFVIKNPLTLTTKTFFKGK